MNATQVIDIFSCLVKNSVGKRENASIFSFSSNVFYHFTDSQTLQPLFTCLQMLLTHSLICLFETIPNSKKLQTPTEMWILNDFLDTDCIKNIVENGEIAHFEQFHIFPQCFYKALFFNVLK